MKLYRQISKQELLQLLQNKKVEGKFSFENPDSAYRKEYGKVICCMRKPITLPNWFDPIMIELEIPEEKIISSGVFKIHETHNESYDEITPVETHQIWEFFITEYNIKEIITIYYIDNYFLNFDLFEEINKIYPKIYKKNNDLYFNKFCVDEIESVWYGESYITCNKCNTNIDKDDARWDYEGNIYCISCYEKYEKCI